MFGEEMPEDLRAQMAAQGFRIEGSGIDRVLMQQAKKLAVQSLRAARAEARMAEMGAAAGAILLSAAACDAYLSEYLEHYEFAAGTPPTELAAVRVESDALEQWRKLIRHEAPEFAMGSCAEYLALGCLFRLRNHIAHRHARMLPPDAWPEGLGDCVRQGVIPVRKGKYLPWISNALVGDVACWAYATARNWIQIVRRLLPLRC